jgi:signal transduction histidine kinase
MTESFHLNLDITSLEHFTPFHVVWNREGVRVHVSKKAHRFFNMGGGDEQPTPLKLIRPFRSPLDPVLFPELTNLILYVSSEGNEHQTLKGELIELHGENGWLFSGLPPAGSIAELETFGVKLSELPLHLGIGDVLLANEAARVSLVHSGRTNEALRQTAVELQERRKSLEQQSLQLSREVDQHQLARVQLEEALHELKTMQGVVVQQERLKAVGEMVSGIAHDFNNLLTPITAYSSLLKTGDSISVSERHEYLDLIMTAAKDAAALIQRLRRLYKPDTANSEYSSFEIGRLADDALALVYPKWSSSPNLNVADIVVNKQYNATGVLIGIQSDIRQALVNLLVNAADALPGSGTITVTTDSHEDTVWISVMDTGVGMAPDVLQQSVQPFFSTKGEYGTGLGLPMVFESALRHGGRVVLESEDGVGSRMTLLFPRSPTGIESAGFGVSASALSTRIEIQVGLDAKEPFRFQSASIRKSGNQSALVMDALLKSGLGSAESPVPRHDDSSHTQSAPSSDSIEDNVRASADSCLHILIVDDDKLIRQALGRAIIRTGHRVLLADDGLEALALCEAQFFDFIVCDVDMPRLRGDAFAVEIKSRQPKSLILLHTGNLDGISDVGRAAADAVLPKPTDALTVLDTGVRLMREGKRR